MIVYISIIVITSVFSNICSQLTVPDDDLTDEMKTYLMRTKVSLSSIYDTVGIIGVNDSYTRGLVTFLLTKKNVDAVLLGSRHSEFLKFGYLETTVNLFCFVNTIDHFEVMVAYAKENPFFNQQGYIQFIVGKRVNNTDWLMDKLRYIWSHDITNYCIIFQIETTVQVIGYNPFNGGIYNFTNHPLGQKIYPDKLLNLYGFKFKVGMVVDVPRNVWRDGVLFGEDKQLLDEILKTMNATLDLKIYEELTDLNDDVKSEKIHFGFTRTFTFSNGKYVVQGSYPVQLDYMVICVPTANLMPQYKYLFLVFKEMVWVAIFLSILIMTLINIHFARKTKFPYYSTSDVFLTTIQIFLNAPYERLFIAKTSFKIVLMSWILFSLLMATAFSTTLRTSLISLKYNDEILTLEDLKDSELKIVINAAVLKDVLQEFDYVKDQLYYVNDTSLVVKMLQEYKKDMAFVLSLTYAEKLVSQKDRWNRYYYRILERYFITGHNVYNFAKNSPYIRIINNYILLFKQFAFSEFGINSLATNNVVSGENVALTLKHMQSTFIILISGCLISFSAFAIELCYFRKETRIKPKKIPFRK